MMHIHRRSATASLAHPLRFDLGDVLGYLWLLSCVDLLLWLLGGRARLVCSKGLLRCSVGRCRRATALLGVQLLFRRRCDCDRFAFSVFAGVVQLRIVGYLAK